MPGGLMDGLPQNFRPRFGPPPDQAGGFNPYEKGPPQGGTPPNLPPMLQAAPTPPPMGQGMPPMPPMPPMPQMPPAMPGMPQPPPIPNQGGGFGSMQMPPMPGFQGQKAMPPFDAMSQRGWGR